MIKLTEGDMTYSLKNNVKQPADIRLGVLAESIRFPVNRTLGGCFSVSVKRYLSTATEGREGQEGQQLQEGGAGRKRVNVHPVNKEQENRTHAHRGAL